MRDCEDFRAVIVIGPTASGKTSLAHGLALAFRAEGVGAELVNLDAFQFFRGVNAGTAKPSPAERREFQYHCLDFLEPDQQFDSADYARMAWKICADIFKRGAVPICVGGSGLYLRSFLHGLDPLPKAHGPLRAFLRESAACSGWPALHGWLRSLDPVRASEVHPNDGVRIERALEVFFVTGSPMSALRSKTDRLATQATLFPALVIHHDAPDDLLRQRIRERIPLMMAEGWYEEVAALYRRFGESLAGFASMRAIGYPEVLACVREQRPVDAEWLARVETATWQYARRQRTWNAKETVSVSSQAGAPENLLRVVDATRRWWREG